jgi:hypothetical protein
MLSECERTQAVNANAEPGTGPCLNKLLAVNNSSAHNPSAWFRETAFRKIPIVSSRPPGTDLLPEHIVQFNKTWLRLEWLLLVSVPATAFREGQKMNAR